MKKVAKFEKVSLKQFMSDWISTFGNKPSDTITEIYSDIKLPQRATKGSAGYDFFSPIDFTLRPNCTIKIPTGTGCFPVIQEVDLGSNTVFSSTIQ